MINFDLIKMIKLSRLSKNFNTFWIFKHLAMGERKEIILLSVILAVIGAVLSIE